MLSEKTAAKIIIAAAIFIAGCPGNRAVVEPTLTENQYIEVIARWNMIYAEYEDDIGQALEEGDTERVIELQEEFALEANRMLEAMDIDPDDVSAFEEANPDFLEQPENQQRVIERIQDLMGPEEAPQE